MNFTVQEEVQIETGGWSFGEGALMKTAAAKIVRWWTNIAKVYEVRVKNIKFCKSCIDGSKKRNFKNISSKKN